MRLLSAPPEETEEDFEVIVFQAIRGRERVVEERSKC
jgi:hypothetical protein